MPFTFSHPAAVLPLKILPRHWFSFTGLIVGSMVPDFEYFIRMNAEVNFSHTVAGVFLFDLPVGIILAFIFHNVIAAALIDNSPSFFSTRLCFLKNCDWNNYFKSNWLKVCLSVIIGAVSHIVWDNFTHEHGHFSRIIPNLTQNIRVFEYIKVTPDMLQHISTLTGAFIIAWYIMQLPVNADYKPLVSAEYWIIAAIIFLLSISLKIWIGLGVNWFNNFTVSCISAGIIAIIATPLFLFTKR